MNGNKEQCKQAWNEFKFTCYSGSLQFLVRKWHILGLFPPVFGMEQCLFCSVRCSNGNFGCLELILVGGGQIYYDATNRV